MMRSLASDPVRCFTNSIRRCRSIGWCCSREYSGHWPEDFLCLHAFGWIEFLRGSSAYITLASGIAVVAFAGNRLMFSNIARKNISRISQLPQRACVFGSRDGGIRNDRRDVGVGYCPPQLHRSESVSRCAVHRNGRRAILASSVFYRGFWETRSPNTDTH